MELRKQCLLVLGMLLGPVLAFAAGGLALAKAKNCLECHAVDQAVVGPAFKDIAAQ
jgi:cytochrome c